MSYNNGTAWKFTWENAHDLATAKSNGKSISYHYDMDGVRDSKTVDGVKHEYITQGGNVTLERWNDGEEKSLEFIYDNGGAPYSVIYSRGNEVDTYYYILNQQGDVIRIVDTSDKTVAEYTYNGWGEILNVSNAKDSEIGTINPILYRGYYYDSELNMYYLQSRYYDPVMKRMIASDDESLTYDATLNNNNLFAYCDNNPVNRADTEGDFWHILVGATLGAATNIAVTCLTTKIEGEKITKETVITAGAVGAVSGAVGVFDSTKLNVAVNAAVAGIAEYRTQRKKKSSVKTTVLNVAFASGTAGGSALAGAHKVRKGSGGVRPKTPKNKDSISKHVKRITSSVISKAKKFSLKASVKKHMGKVNWKNYSKNLVSTSFTSTYFFNAPKSFAHRIYKLWKNKLKNRRR